MHASMGEVYARYQCGGAQAGARDAFRGRHQGGRLHHPRKQPFFSFSWANGQINPREHLQILLRRCLVRASVTTAYYQPRSRPGATTSSATCGRWRTTCGTPTGPTCRSTAQASSRSCRQSSCPRSATGPTTSSKIALVFARGHGPAAPPQGTPGTAGLRGSVGSTLDL